MEGKQRSSRISDRDAVLVKACQAGDIPAFDSLVLSHQDHVVNLLYWFLGDIEEASDCAQETFIKVFKSLRSFRFESAFSTWLYRVAVNTFKNRLKSSGFQWKKKTVSLENPGEQRVGG